MATVDTTGDPILITYEVPVSKAADFKQGVIDLFQMDQASTNVQVADKIAEDLRERVRRNRRRDAGQAAAAVDPGTIDFS